MLLAAPAAPATPPVAAAPIPVAPMPEPALPPVDNPWRRSPDTAPATPEVATPARYGVPQPVQRPANPIMPPNPFAKGAQTDRGPLPPQLPVRHEAAAIPVAFAQFSEPAPATEPTAEPAEVVILRPSLAEALEAALAELPEDAPDHAHAPEPFPDTLTIAPPAKAAPGWS
ncbi:MAG TPA: hypothetical protein VG650_16125 [Mycobacteriales bacterium]|nr:hypothetical protein [Mycobacteriales bacterium]